MKPTIAGYQNPDGFNWTFAGFWAEAPVSAGLAITPG